jgi:polysaccharide export outer membrane protein
LRLSKAIGGIATALLLAAVPAVQAAPQLPARVPNASGLPGSRVVYDAYILGPGDSLQVELLDIPELSGTFSIGPDGTIFLPRLRALYVEGLTVEELRYFLTQQFKINVKNPQLYVRPVGYRPTRVYVGGEVRRPGFYTLRGSEMLPDEGQFSSQQLEQGLNFSNMSTGLAAARTNISTPALGNTAESNKQAFPTVFDAIRAAQGISPFSDLAKVQVTRKQPLSAGGGRIRTNLNFLSLITEGDESQNIRLFDGDVVSVGRSDTVLRDQLIRAGRTNLSPQFINVFVTGRVNTPGAITLQQGSSLNQAISVAGGVKLIKGKVEFLRFLSDGKTDRRTFSFSANAASDSYSNPILTTGDIIRVNDSPLSAGVSALNEFTSPLLGIYSIYALTNGAFR